jgi:TRAP-type C4-dicarboxylate transport system substrate-binding protein
MHLRTSRFLAAAMLLVVANAVSAETVTLRLADSLPAGHNIHGIATKPFIDGVAAATKGELKLQHYPGEQLGKAKDLLALTQTGVADIGWVTPAYTSDKTPLSGAFELPAAFPDYCQATRALWALTHDGGWLEKNEFVPNGIVALVTLLVPPYQMQVSSNRAVKSLDDLAGLKLRSPGGPMDFLLKSLNMVPVRMAPPEMYEAMSRKTVDGVLFSLQSSDSYSLIELLKSSTFTENLGTVVLTYSIGQAKWKGLSEAHRKALLDTGKQVSLASCEKFIAAEKGAQDKARARKVAPIEFNAADRKRLETAFAQATKEWAASLDQRGKPGSATLEAVHKALAASK